MLSLSIKIAARWPSRPVFDADDQFPPRHCLLAEPAGNRVAATSDKKNKLAGEVRGLSALAFDQTVAGSRGFPTLVKPIALS